MKNQTNLKTKLANGTQTTNSVKELDSCRMSCTSTIHEDCGGRAGRRSCKMVAEFVRVCCGHGGYRNHAGHEDRKGLGDRGRRGRDPEAARPENIIEG